MSLQTNQIYVYSPKTSDFYSKEEKEVRDKYNTLEFYDKNLNEYESQLHKHIAKGNLEKKEKVEKLICDLNERKRVIMSTNKDVTAKTYRAELRRLVKSHTDKRTFYGDENKLKKIGQFTSGFTRAIGIKEEILTREHIAFTENFMVIQVSKDVDEHIQNEIMSQLIENGFTFNNKDYTYAYSSAGAIRTRRLLFVDSKVYEQAQGKLYAGLTLDKINAKGGIVAGKYLAYKALASSSSLEWSEYQKFIGGSAEFNIRRCIVIPDIEYTIESVLCEHIDHEYQITKMHKDFINPLSDGCGYCLPSFSKHNVQVRAPWIKGLLTPVSWETFAEEHDIDLDTFTLIDAWGVKRSLKNVDVIFTESQFKMKKYYESWDEYVEAFERHNCEFAVCNVESLNKDDFKESSISYQMLQSLYSVSAEEIEQITSYTRDCINNINMAARDWDNNSQSKQLLLDVLGVNKDYTYKRPFIEAIGLVDDILHDKYVQTNIRSRRDSHLKAAKAAKLLMEGSKTVYILPDTYAVMQSIFGLKVTGMLEADEVACRLFKDGMELAMERSPHLYLEHVICHNINNEDYNKWYTTNGVYVSVKSLASFILSYDNDGDTCQLIPNDKSSSTFVKVAKRHMEDILPLSYEMSKGTPINIDNKALTKALKKSFSANIGTVSNTMTKLLNKGEINAEDLELMKVLKMKSNLIIDYAKTNFNPQVKDANLKEQLKIVKELHYPYFFKYAKNKAKDEVEECNTSTVNRISRTFESKLSKMRFVPGEFDHTIYMYDKDIEIDENIVNTYKLFVNDKSNSQEAAYSKEGEEDILFYRKSDKAIELEEKLLQINNNRQIIVDVLIKYLYQKHYNDKGKRIYLNKNLGLFWDALGDVIVENIKINLGLISKVKRCECGALFELTGKNQKYCKPCKKEHSRKQAAERQRKKRAEAKKNRVS